MAKRAPARRRPRKAKPGSYFNLEDTADRGEPRAIDKRRDSAAQSVLRARPSVPVLLVEAGDDDQS